MPNNVDSVIANEALQQTSASPCSPRLFVYFFSTLATRYKMPCYKSIYYPVLITVHKTRMYLVHSLLLRFMKTIRCLKTKSDRKTNNYINTGKKNFVPE